jgi:large subunit ribosomal protein L21
MYAIVNIAGTQFKVEKDRFYYTPLLDGKDGDKVEFEEVLLTEDGDNIQIGTPLLKGIKVSAKILGHVKGDKVIVFKKKRRKGYRKKNGHRQNFTKLLIEDIK